MFNFFISLIGWVAWNVLMFRIEKDKYDETDSEFPLKQYVLKTYDNWLASFVMIPVLLYLGYIGFNFNALGVIDLQHLDWSDAYYLASGIFTELVIKIYKAWNDRPKSNV